MHYAGGVLPAEGDFEILSAYIFDVFNRSCGARFRDVDSSCLVFSQSVF